MQSKPCEICGVAVFPPSEPVTIGGWYGGWRFRWDNGQLAVVAVRCPEHKAQWYEDQELIGEEAS